ncbi:DUF4097 family beta strand repeat-containing protein [Streptomyces sp. NPDC017993]|uniref:DUF4097 family beta strand repeat-containing protein n=1 Tax=Streptomyces sp. NPDC017993 TaxID=3365027 RepID=UPI0037A516AB
MKLPALTALAVATTGVLMLTSCTEHGPARPNRPAGDQNKKVSSTSYEVGGPASQLSVDTTAGDVHVTASDRSGIKVTEKITYTGDKPRTSHTSHDGKVALRDSDCRSGTCSVSYRIEAPSRLASRIASGGGDITGTALAGSTVAKTNGGEVRLGFAHAPADIDAFSGGGDVRLELPAGKYAVTARTNGGDRKVDVTTDAGSAHKVRARSNGGDVTIKQT